MKITKKQIVALDKKEKTVRELFPEVFKTKLKTGKWYKVNTISGNWLFFITDITQKRRKGYGFDLSGKEYLYTIIFDSSLDSCFDRIYTPATKEEVKIALINEAKKRGFKDGADYLSLNKKNKRKVNYPLKINRYKDALCCINGGIIFFDGFWAEIIQPKEMTKEEIEK